MALSVLIVIAVKGLRSHFVEKMNARRPERTPWKNWGTGITAAWIIAFASLVAWSGYESCIPSSTYQLYYNPCR